MSLLPEDRALLIVAAGQGSRMLGDAPKQYRVILDKSVLRHTIDACLEFFSLKQIHVVISEAHQQDYAQAISGLDMPQPIIGGQTRQESVWRGLQALQESGAPQLVLIHDAARPFVTKAMIADVVQALDNAPAATLAQPVGDSLCRGRDRIERFVDRSNLSLVQTPQGFDFRTLYDAHAAVAATDDDEVYTDDCSLMMAQGHAVVLTPGATENFKITWEEDMARAKAIMEAGSRISVGNGFDVHRLGPGDHVILCGVRINHDQSLIGYSDADVALHALTDALLGAIGAGDIGMHFPPSNPKWRDAQSSHFLEHAAGLVRERGGIIDHVDLTLICERPKLQPHRLAMRKRLAEILKIAEDRISLKATTTEGLGFPGRGEGIAALATATVRQL